MQSSEGDAQRDHDTPALGSHNHTDWQQVGDSSNYGRGKRQRCPNQHYTGDIWANYRNHELLPKKVRTGVLIDQYHHSLNWEQTIDMVRSGDLQSLLAQIELETDPDAGTMEALFPMALAAKANANDNPNWDQAMNGPNAKGYMKACKIELNTLEGKEAWDVIPRQPWMNILPRTWAFKCKRCPDGMVQKLKARFCVHGDRQVEGVDFIDTFAPVINWQTVRLMLILSLILNLQTKQVDYTAAFLHAPIDKDPNWDTMNLEERNQSRVYIQMPRGFSKLGKVLKLKRSLYGLNQSPHNFFQHLKSKLESIGFELAEDTDPCLFLSDKVICLVYVDDTLFYSPKAEYIDEAIEKLRTAGIELDIEQDVARFLGVHIDQDPAKGTVKLSQKGLAICIVRALGVDHLQLPKCDWNTPISTWPLKTGPNICGQSVCLIYTRA